MLSLMARPSKMRHSRPPRIRVPNNERALFTVDSQRLAGIIHRLSLTGGSTTLGKGPLSEGTIGHMVLNTVFGRVAAEVEFMHSGADGKPNAQAFRFLHMDDTSSKRFAAAAQQMQEAGFSDVEGKENVFGDLAKGWDMLRESVRQLSGKKK